MLYLVLYTTTECFPLSHFLLLLATLSVIIQAIAAFVHLNVLFLIGQCVIIIIYLILQISIIMGKAFR